MVSKDYMAWFNFDFNVSVQTYRYRKPSIPDDEEGKLQLSSKLLSFGVSLKDYQESLAQDEITP